MQSTGQGGRQSLQPVHSSAITVCICLAAPRIASTGRLYAEGATNTGLFVNHRQQWNLEMFTMLGVEIEYLGIEQCGKCNDCCLPSRRALIDGCFTVCNGLGIGSATRVGALSALRLR